MVNVNNPVILTTHNYTKLLAASIHNCHLITFTITLSNIGIENMINTSAAPFIAVKLK
jgi:hypothetical protein